MAKVDAQLVALNRGEVSKLALGRVDIDKLKLAADCQLNFEPSVVGPMGLRPGLQFVGEVLGDNPAVLVDFFYAKSDTALLEFTANTLRIWINEALLTRPSVATAISDPAFAGGGAWSLADSTAGTTATIGGGVLTLTASPIGALARAKQSISVAGGDQAKEHGLRFTISNGPVTVRIGSADGLSDVLSQTVLDTGTHSLSFVPGRATIYLQIDSTDQWQKTLTGCSFEAAGVVTLPTPWNTAALASLRWEQKGDIVYLASYGFQQYKIERRGTRPGARGWSVVLYRSSNGPFHEAPDAELTLTPGACVGNTTVAASKPFFSAQHAGALLRLFSPGQQSTLVLGAGEAYTPAIRVAGVGNSRLFHVDVNGTWVGTLSLQRSFVGPDSGFSDIDAADTGWGSVPVLTGNFGTSYLDINASSGSNFQNVVVWYRLGFKAGNYTSGSAIVQPFYSDGGRFGIARILSVSSPLQASVEVLEGFSSTNATADWQISDWCAAFGWPTSVTFHDGRLWWFSGGTIPIAGSQSSDFTGFAEEDYLGQTLGDSAAVLEAFGDGPGDSVNWALPLTRLLCGREGSIASVRSSSFDEPLTPTNFSVKDCATQGASRMPALKVDKRGLFVQQSGRRFYELVFDAQAMDYSARDLTRLNHDVGKPGFVGAAVARQRDTIVYLPRGDGQCATLLYDPEDEVVAWSRLQTLGLIEGQPCVLPVFDDLDDFVYFVVNRKINGVTRRFIEKLARRDDCVGGLVNRLLDSHVVYQGAPSATVTAAHLPNTLVAIWADGVSLGSVTTNGGGVATLPGGATASNIVVGLGGATATYSGAAVTALTGLSAYEGLPCEVFADQQPRGHMMHLGTFTVSGGAVALPANQKSSAIVAYFGFMAPFMSAKLAYGAKGGSTLTKKKKIDHLGMVLFDAHPQGLRVGQRFDVLDPLPLIEDGGAVDPATVWSEYDATMMELPGEWDTDSRLCLLGQAPFPVKVGGLVISLETSSAEAHV
jgi:hypothetical protein